MKLFEPGKIGRLNLKNRIVMSGMASGIVEQNGSISQSGIDFYAARARGGVGLIITSAARIGVIEKIPGIPIAKLMVVDSKEHMSGLKRLAEVAHEHGTKVAVQLTAGRGRNIHTEVLRSIGAVAPSPAPSFADPNVIAREITIEEIEQLIQAFQFSAELVREAGADAIEINAHGGYLIDEFMTALWNKRTDKYGGDLDGRLRFLLESIESIGRGAGAGFPLMVKYPLTHYLEGGREIDEGLEIARRLEAAGVDALDIDAGCYETMYWFIPPTTQPPGSMLNLAAKVKEVVNIPVVSVGKLGYPKLAERALQDGKADFVALGRALLADPEWADKVKEGRLEDIRPCIGVEDGCLAITLEGQPITCAVNPMVGREKELAISLADKRKSVLVVGGGPSGMEAARVAALRGHKVTLWEKGHALGGNLRLSSVPDFKQDYRLLIKYLSNQIKKLGVTVEFGKEATPELIQRMKPDVVFVAAGGTPIIPEILGKDGDNVTSSPDILRMFNGLLKWSTIKKKGWQKIIWFFGNLFTRFLEPSTIERLAKFWLPFGKRVIIIGGAYYGCEMALLLAQKGRKVTVVESSGPDNVAHDMFLGNRMHLLKLLEDNGVDILTDTETLEITDEGIIIADKSGKKSTLRADTMMFSIDLKPNNALLKALEGKVPEVYALGDCVEPRKSLAAIHDAFHAARQI